MQSTITGSSSTGDIFCPEFGCSRLGGLVGEARQTTSIGGLVGAASQNVANSYWSRDTSTQSTSAGNAVSATLAQLQCATPTSTNCAPVPLFVGWNGYTDADGSPYWNFGTTTQLPGLCLSGQLYRDADANGVLDTVSNCGGSVLQAVVNVYDQFTGGYCARLTVSNTGTIAVDPWLATFTVQGTLNQAWNMTYTQSGSTVTAQPVNWNPRLEPGQSTHDIGFCAAL